MLSKISVLALMFTLNAFAGETLMYVKQITLPVDVSTAKVRISSSGYSMPLVKILVPELAAVTLMNHRNVGEGAPCMSTTQAFEVSEVVQNRPAIEKAKFVIKLIKTATPDVANKSCYVSLTETITTNVRGFVFTHSRTEALPERDLADCK